MDVSEDMDRLAADMIRRYSEMKPADLRRLASRKGHAETVSARGYTITVDCAFDSASRDAVKVIASVSRGTLLSSMFPRSKAALVETG